MWDFQTGSGNKAPNLEKILLLPKAEEFHSPYNVPKNSEDEIGNPARAEFLVRFGREPTSVSRVSPRTILLVGSIE